MAEFTIQYPVLVVIALFVLPVEIWTLVRHRDWVKTQVFLRYRQYLRLWTVGGAILAPGFFLLLGAALLDRAEPTWPFGVISLGALGVALFGTSRIFLILRSGKARGAG